jgi:glutamyl-tRNA reductase
MSLVCLSFSHHNAPIEFRERIFFDADSIANACARFRCGTDQPSNLRELVIVSTCNRTEFYAYASSEIPADHPEIAEEMLQFVLDARDIEIDELKENGRFVYGSEVATHLSQVASGVRSLVLGEPQILGQVGDAMRLGIAMNSAGTVLTRLFQTAIRAGRRARTETKINSQSLNVSTVAVNTIEHEMGDLADKTVAVLGAGEMADLALGQLRNRGASKVIVVNRTLEKANELAAKHSGQAFVFEQIANVLQDADVLVTSTGAPHTLITRDMTQAIMKTRPQRKLAILDIAVPRDVDPTVEEIENVFRCDIDDLRISTDQAATIRKQQIPRVKEIVTEEVANFLVWLRSVGVDSIVAGLHKKAESIRLNEMTRLLRMQLDLGSEQQAIIDRFSRSLVKKLLHDPIVRLRASQLGRDGITHADTLSHLFDLEVESATDTGIADPRTSLPIENRTNV